MPRRRLVVVGGGTAGINAIRTIREVDGDCDVTLVSDERPYSRMVLPYYLEGTITRSHVFTLTPPKLARLGVDVRHLGARAVGLDASGHELLLAGGVRLEYDALLIATGSSPADPAVSGRDLPCVHSFWTLPQADALTEAVGAARRVAVIGGGFVAFTMLNALLARGAEVTVIELAPRILPRMIDEAAATLVEHWLRSAGVSVRTGATVQAICQRGAGCEVVLADGQNVEADVVVMATGTRPNLGWLDGLAETAGGVVVDGRMLTSLPDVYAAGDVAAGPDRVTGGHAIHATELTAMEHGRIAGANMAGRDVRYRGSVQANVLDVRGLEVVGFGDRTGGGADSFASTKDRGVEYRRLFWAEGGDRLTGAILVGRTEDVGMINDIGILKGLVDAGIGLGEWKEMLRRDPWDVKRAFVATRHIERILPERLLRPDTAASHA